MSLRSGILREHRPDRVGFGDDRPLSILAVTSELPWPLNTGGHLWTFHMLRVLAQRFRVRLVSAVEPGQEPSVDALCQLGIGVCPVEVGARALWSEAAASCIGGVAWSPMSSITDTTEELCVPN